MSHPISHQRSLKLPILALICASLVAVAIWASPAQAYTGHAGCPNAASGQTVQCADHSNWRWFNIYTHNYITVYALYSTKVCAPGWCSVDTGLWHTGHASYYNHLGQVTIWGMQAYYYDHL